MTVKDEQARSAELKTIGASGQVYLGKAYAGRAVMIEQPEPGVWLIRTATVIPDNERWLHTPQAQARLQRTMAWAQEHPAQISTAEELEALRNQS